MAGKSDTWESDVLKLLFQGIAIANIADNASASPLGFLYFGLHTADPGETGNQTTSETTYGGYARQPQARTTGGFTVSGSNPTQVQPTANIDFPTVTSGSGTITNFHIGHALTGTGKIYYFGAVSPTIPITVGAIPRITSGSTVTED